MFKKFGVLHNWPSVLHNWPTPEGGGSRGHPKQKQKQLVFGWRDGDQVVAGVVASRLGKFNALSGVLFGWGLGVVLCAFSLAALEMKDITDWGVRQ